MPAFTFSCTPVVDEDRAADAPGIAGVWCRVSSTLAGVAPVLPGEPRDASLVSHLPVAVYTCDEAGRITYFNRRAAELWGREPALGDEDRRFCGSLRLWRPDGTELPHAETPMANAIRTGASVRDQEVIIEQPSGARVAVSVNVDALSDDAGRHRGAINVFQDITARRSAERSRDESEERLRLATQSGKVGLWEWDIGRDHVTWTDSLYPIHGVDPATFEPTVKGFAELVHPDDRAMVAERIRQTLEEDAPYEMEFRILRPDGGVVWFFTNATVQRVDGRPTRMLGASFDITARREAELALREAKDRLEERVRERTAELAQANARFRAMYDQGLFAGLIALDGTLIDVNRTWLEASGFTAEQVLNRPFWDTGWWSPSPETRAWIKIGFAEAVQGKGFHGETTCYTADGSERRLDFALMPIREDSGEISFVVPTGFDITERRRAEVRLQAAEVARETDARFRRLADHAPVLIWMADVDNAGTWFNLQWLELVGRPLERELGTGWLENVHPDDVETCAQLRGEAFAVREPFELEFRMRRHDGEYRWMLDHGVPTFGQDGAFAGYTGTCVDISERKQAEIALHRFSAIVESSEDAIIAKDLDGIITNWNPAAQRMFGYTPEEIIGHPVLQLIPADRHMEEPGILERIRRGERIQHFETVRQRKNGRQFDVSLSISPIKDDSGRIVGAAKILRDVTDRKRIEAELLRREQLYRAVGESIDYGIWVCDAAGRNTYTSESFLQLTGLTQAECSEFGWKRILHPDDAEATIAAWQECARAGGVWEYEHRVLGVDGAWHPVLARGVPVRDEKGAIVNWAGINLDISSLKRNEEALQRKTRNLEVLNRVGRTLAAERDLEKVVQAVTDAGREMSTAALGAFFYNTRNDRGDSYMLFALAGAQEKDFGGMGMPRSTPLFGPTFRGEGPVRIGDVPKDPRYGTMAPDHGMPHGHLPVRSYLAVPVVSRSGEVHGGLFYGHPEPDVFTEEAENLVVAIAAQAAIAIDNANLYGGMQREIQEHERAERALRESEERFRTLADNIAAFAWTADRLGWATWYNRRWYDYTGTTFADMQDRGWESVQHPDHIERVRHGLQRCLERGDVWEDTFPLRRHDGEFRWFLSRAVPIHDADGRVVRWFGTNTDITDQKAAEEKLRLRSARMQFLSEMLADLLGAETTDVFEQKLFPKVAAHLGVDCFFNFIADEEHRILRLRCSQGIDDETARTIATLQYGEGISGTVAETHAAIVADDIQRARGEMSALVRRWGIQSYACQPLMVGSRLLGTLSFASRQRPRFDEGELEFLRIVSQSVAVALDRLRSARALRESEERFRTLADNIAQFAWTADPEGWIFWYNRRWFDYTGTTLEEMEGWGWQKVHHPEHVDRVTEKFARHIASGEVWEDTFPLRRDDGEYRWFLSRAVPIRDAEGRVVRWFGTNTDITAQREAEFALERARDEAVAASGAKDDFLAALSHELRTPLNPVLLLASDAADNPALPDHVRADFESIRKNVSLEARLIDDLLDLTRISRGKLLLDFEDHDVHAILRDAMATIQPDAAEKKVALTLELQAGKPVVRGDAVRLQQVFWNVFKNAVKFTPAGGRIEISTRQRPDDPQVEVRVTDTGIGLTAAEIPRIFDAFSQGDHAAGSEAHRFGGLGLGLAISRMVVEMHGGEISAASSGPGQGATFVIALPLVIGSLGTTPSSSVPPPPEPSAIRPAGGRILLVEDHAPTRAALERLLQRRKFFVAAAGTLAEARARLREGKFDLLISDIGLPDGSGCDLMRLCANEYRLSGIALTGYGMEQDVARSREAGFSAHLTKPIAANALDRAIAGVLNPEEKPA